MQSEKGCGPAKRPNGRAILTCPDCLSHRAEIVEGHPLRAQCDNCETIYTVQTVKPHRNGHCCVNREHKTTQKRYKTKADYRSEITPAPALSDQELGPNTVFMPEVIEATPEQIVKAEHIAQKYSAKFGQEFEASWFLETDWLTKLKSVNRVRARGLALAPKIPCSTRHWSNDGVRVQESERCLQHRKISSCSGSAV